MSWEKALRFEWDENKRQKTIEKHGVDFRDIAAAWIDRPPLGFRSDQNSEERYVGFAKIKGEQWACIYTVREGNIRLISARKWKERDSRKLGQLLD
jgi:uncharacterized protein